jgi:hypothetical protein
MDLECGKITTHGNGYDPGTDWMGKILIEIIHEIIIKELAAVNS